MSDIGRDELVYYAELAEQTERYEEMVKFMLRVVNMGEELSVKERNLLSVAYKNVIGARRASWRIISDLEGKNRDKDTKRSELAERVRYVVEEELKKICNEILDLLNEQLLKSASTSDAKVFYYKMKGDYCRYLAEFTVADERKNAAEDALIAYKVAKETAEANLPPTHPIRLGLALNFSVFFYEILSSKTKACEIAKSAFDEAISELETLNEESYKDSTLIMQLLRDNLTLWASSQQSDAGDDFYPAN